MRIKELAKECHNTAKAKGFWDKERNLGELLMLITSELGEALEADRKDKYADLEKLDKLRQEGRAVVSSFQETVKDTFEDELADVLIRLLDLVEAKGIDIERHITLKMEYNKTRERLHGKKY